jgi:hypothetical protein
VKKVFKQQYPSHNRGKIQSIQNMMHVARAELGLLGLILLMCRSAQAFLPQSASRKSFAPSCLAATKTTLSDETTWKFRVILRGVTTDKGKKVDEIFSMSAQFVEEEGYEPPQGSLNQVDGDDALLQIVKSRWQLSEDPNDRRDGLWIWGLFAEPLYPFLLLTIETGAIPLASGNEEEKDFIKPLRLYAQINHKRDSDVGVILEGAGLSVRQVETIKADPFGASTVDIYDEVNVGTISIQSVTSSVARL